MYIDHLSGSEADRESQSSADDNEAREADDDNDLDTLSISDLIMGDSWHSNSSGPNDRIDIDNGVLFPQVDELSPFTLMQKWDGGYEMVHIRSTSRHPTPSIEAPVDEDSTPTEAALIVDEDAVEDGSTSSFWSGDSDDHDDGETTDSMAEEDMPIIGSPVLNELIAQKIGPGPERGSDVPMTGSSETASAQPPPASPTASISRTPVMGNFYPTNNDPNHFAVIEPSRQTTKSPFTYKRRPRRSSVTSEDQPPRVRSSSFSTTHSTVVAPVLPLSMSRKRARYTSIPGHPKHKAALRAMDELETELEALEAATFASTAETGLGLDFELEDLLEMSALDDSDDEGDDEMDGEGDLASRFRASGYLKRNMMAHDASWQDPGQAFLEDGSMSMVGVNPARLAIVSGKIAEEASITGARNELSRKEKRKARRRAKGERPVAAET